MPKPLSPTPSGRSPTPTPSTWTKSTPGPRQPATVDQIRRPRHHRAWRVPEKARPTELVRRKVRMSESLPPGTSGSSSKTTSGTTSSPERGWSTRGSFEQVRQKVRKHRIPSWSTSTSCRRAATATTTPTRPGSPTTGQPIFCPKERPEQKVRNSEIRTNPFSRRPTSTTGKRTQRWVGL